MKPAKDHVACDSNLDEYICCDLRYIALNEEEYQWPKQVG